MVKAIAPIVAAAVTLCACPTAVLTQSARAATSPGRLDQPRARIDYATNLRSLAVSLDRRIVLAGADRRGIGMHIPITFGDFESVTRIGVVGLTANGRADRDYGRLGLALGPRIPFAEGGEGASAAVRDARGYILVAGSVSHGDDLSGDDATVVRRFRPSGALDRSFGRRGVLRVDSPGGGQPLEQLIAMLDADTAVLAVETTIAKYSQWGGGAIRTLSAGYDREDPAVSLRSGCRWMRVRIRDTSPLDRVIVHIDRRVVRRTTRKRLRLRVHPGQRVSVTAVDAAGNPARVRTTVPRC